MTGTQEIAAPLPMGEPVPVETAPEPVPEQVIIADPVEAFDCDPSYPDICIPPGSADLDCGEIGARRFTVYPPDSHGFDGDFDGVGCESG